jgi:hypothetical protein
MNKTLLTLSTLAFLCCTKSLPPVDDAPEFVQELNVDVEVKEPISTEWLLGDLQIIPGRIYVRTHYDGKVHLVLNPDEMPEELNIINH